jgi:hypothetical protein
MLVKGTDFLGIRHIPRRRNVTDESFMFWSSGCFFKLVEKTLLKAVTDF